jgi:hypothetical protein
MSDCIKILEEVKISCSDLELLHNQQFFKYKKNLKYFKLPLIILSSFNSVISVGLSEYVSNQSTISSITCGISLVCSIISSIELYLKIELSMARELESAKTYNILYLQIDKYLKLDDDNRAIDEKAFLIDCYAEYIKLYSQSKLLKNNIQMVKNQRFAPSVKNNIQMVENDLSSKKDEIELTSKKDEIVSHNLQSDTQVLSVDIV